MKNTSNKRLKFIYLFAGVGGFLAFNNKAHCTFASEIDLNIANF